jgi:hypothetical protein
MPRRMITIDDKHGKSKLLEDAELSFALTDPARPGFKRFQIWMTETTPALFDSVESVDQKSQLPYPPKNGSVCHIYHLPPDEKWIGHIKESDVQRYFQSIQAIELSLFDRNKHPYFQKSNALEFCMVLKGEVDLILDKETIHLQQGDTVVQKASNHAWSNRSQQEVILATSSHAGLLS